MKTKYTESLYFCPLVLDYQNLFRVIEGYKAQGKKVTLTMGVFDMYHIGHLLYLEKARATGDILIVGIDSDELTRKRKGKDRPIAPEDERVSITRAQRCVDVVTVRGVDEEMGELIKLLKPDVLVVSETTKDKEDFAKRMKEKHGKNCGEIVILPPQATTSTTARIRNLVHEGAVDLKQKINEVVEAHMNALKGGGS